MKITGINLLLIGFEEYNPEFYKWKSGDKAIDIYFKNDTFDYCELKIDMEESEIITHNFLHYTINFEISNRTETVHLNPSNIEDLQALQRMCS